VVLLDNRNLGEDLSRAVLKSLIEALARDADQRGEAIWIELTHEEETYRAVRD